MREYGELRKEDSADCMSEIDNKETKFKPTSKRHQPRGMKILYEDRDILVVNKDCGLLTVSNDKVREKTAYFLLNNYVRKGNQKSRKRVFIVHRLDRDTSGVLVFAKSLDAKRYLQDQWPAFNKTYVAVVHGILPKKDGTIVSYLVENQAHKVYSVNDAKLGKLARTKFRVVKESARYSLLEIQLLTGRKNQIRVHFADKGHPVAGDRKYGENKKGGRRLALHAASLTIFHPHTKEAVTFESPAPSYFKTLMKSKK